MPTVLSSNDTIAQDYYPGALVSLLIRLDEFGKSTRLPPAPKKPAKALTGTADDRGTLKVVKDDSGKTPRYVLQSSAGTDKKPIADMTHDADKLEFPIAGIIPKTADWQQNGIRAADTLTVTLRYIDAPFDPRVIRGAAVEFYLGTMSSTQFADNFKAQSAVASLSSGRGLMALPYSFKGPRGEERSNLRFQGWVDQWTVENPENGEPTVKLVCRDNTQLFIDQEVPPNFTIDPTKPLDKAIAQYLSFFSQFEGMAVEYRPAGGDPPVLKDVASVWSGKPGAGPTPAKGGGASGPGKLTLWDYLTDVVRSVGHAIRIEGMSVVIQRVRSLLSGATVSRSNDPFDRRVIDHQVFDSRLMVYGRNILEMKTDRKFSRHTPTNVEVVCYQNGGKSKLVARFPNGEDKQTYTLPGQAQGEQKWTVFTVTGINDAKTLQIHAQDTYESLNRNELGMEIKTKNLASFGGDNEDPDLLDMMPGDSLEILTERDGKTGQNSVSGVEDLLLAQKASQENLLTTLGFSPELAEAYARAYTDANFQTIFRVKTVKTSWNSDQGVDFSISCVNYIEVRMDKHSQDEPTTSTTKPRPPQGGPPPAGGMPLQGG